MNTVRATLEKFGRGGTQTPQEKLEALLALGEEVQTLGRRLRLLLGSQKELLSATQDGCLKIETEACGYITQDHHIMYPLQPVRLNPQAYLEALAVAIADTKGAMETGLVALRAISAD